MSDYPPPESYGSAPPPPITPPPAGHLSASGRYDPGSFRVLYIWILVLYIVGFPLMFVCVGIFPLIAAVVLQCIFLYRAWHQIQDGYARTSPGKAVGFQFIPFFNLYWIFVAFHGLAKDLSGYIQRHHINTRPPSEGLALAYCILSLCSIIPYLGILTAIAAIIVLLIFLNSVKIACQEISTTPIP